MVPEGHPAIQNLDLDKDSTPDVPRLEFASAHPLPVTIVPEGTIAADATPELGSAGLAGGAHEGVTRFDVTPPPERDANERGPEGHPAHQDELEGHPAPTPASEDAWLHRSRKRQDMVNNVKATAEYEAFVAVKRRRLPVPGAEGGADVGSAPGGGGGGGGPPTPRTPDPLDRSLSKRQWDLDLSQWRVALRVYAEQRCRMSADG